MTIFNREEQRSTEFWPSTSVPDLHKAKLQCYVALHDEI